MRTPVSLWSFLSRRWISGWNGPKTLARGARRQLGGRSLRSARRIVLRDSPVDLANSLIDFPATKCSRRSSAHCSTETTLQPLPIVVIDDETQHRLGRLRPLPKGGQFSRGGEGSVSTRRRHTRPGDEFAKW